MRAKLIATVAILWVAAVGAITVAFYATRTTGPTAGKFAACLDTHDIPYCQAQDFEAPRYFDWGGWLAWSGIATLVAVAAIGIIYVLTRKAD